jgi:hypothetical protein
MRLPVVLALAAAAVGAPARAADRSLTAFVMPSRNAAHIRERLGRIAVKVASRLHAELAQDAPARDALGEQLQRARTRTVSGALDEAARLFDAALGGGARAPQLVIDSDAFIAAHLRRASIALARAELQTARILIARVYRYDPTLQLDPLETTPQLAAIFDDVRAKLGPAPAIEPDDLGELCARPGILLVGRPRQAAAFEVSRFDDCRATARVVVAATDTDDPIVAALAIVPPIPAASGPPIADRARSRREGLGKQIAGPLMMVAGVALAGVGSYYAQHAAWRLDHIGDGCSIASPCTGTTVPDRSDDYRASTAIASVLVPLGATAIVGGAVLTALGVRERRGVSVALSLREVALLYRF